MFQQKLEHEQADGGPGAYCVRRQKVAEMLDISTRTLSRKVARGEFPKPIRIGKGTTRWRLRDIEAYLGRTQRG